MQTRKTRLMKFMAEMRNVMNVTIGQPHHTIADYVDTFLFVT